MKFRIRFAEQITGLFIILAIASLAAILIFMGANQRWFRKNYYFYSYFTSASGLNSGMEISMKGFPIGKVTNVYMLDDSYKIRMDFYIYGEEISRLNKNTIIELLSNPLGLGGGLVIYTKEDQSQQLMLLPENAGKGIKKDPIYIYSLDTEEGLLMVENDMVDRPKSDDLINNTINRIQGVIANLESVTQALDGRGNGPLVEILANVNQAIIDVSETLNSVQMDVSRISSGATTVISGVNNIVSGLDNDIPGILSDVDQITSDLKITTSAISEPGGLVKHLLDPKGSIAKLLDDDNEMFDSITSLMAQVGTIIEEVSGEIDGLSRHVSSLLKVLTTKGDNLLTDVSGVINTVQDKAVEIIDTVQVEVTGITTEMGGILANLSTLSEELKDPTGLIPRLLEDDNEIFANMAEVLQTVQGLTDQLTTTLSSVTEDIDEIVGTVSTVLTDLTESVSGVEEIITNVSSLSEGLSEAEGLVPRLLDPKGSIATLLDDDNELFNQITTIVAGLDSTVKQLQEFAEYINSTSPQITGILEEGRNALDEGTDVLEGLSNNPIISGGITEEEEQQTTFQSFRDEDF